MQRPETFTHFAEFSKEFNEHVEHVKVPSLSAFTPVNKTEQKTLPSVTTRLIIEPRAILLSFDPVERYPARGIAHNSITGKFEFLWTSDFPEEHLGQLAEALLCYSKTGKFCESSTQQPSAAAPSQAC